MNEPIPFRLRSLNELEKLHFVVKKYQRGYKWDVQQVLELLSDIDEFQIAEDSIYCLQPIVVKTLPQGYELIDGQQRITTLYIILSVIANESYFDISYQTREASESFIRNIIEVPALESNILVESDIQKFEVAIGLFWNTYVATEVTRDNIDNFHFFSAYQTVMNWKRNKPIERLQSLVNKIKKYTAVIWYEVDQEESSENVFSKLNSGKIALTGAELIKALFILQIQEEMNIEVRDSKQNALASEWDYIENTLQDDTFWYFIKGAQKMLYTTRIDFLFDLLSNKPKGLDDPLFSYREYATLFSAKQPLRWEKTQQLFHTLQEWYQNRKTFHLIGFIINAGILNISAVLQVYYKATGKGNFTQHLIQIIRQEFARKKSIGNIEYRTYSLHNLNYLDNYDATKNVLLLFNIETVQKADANFRFPFDRYHNNEGWSLEHIHPQNPKDINSVHEALDWISDQTNRMKQPGEFSDVEKTEFDEFAEGLKKEKELSKDHLERIKGYSLKFTERFNLHGISNLALLDSQTNSAIGNGKFLKKRAKVLEIDRSGKLDLGKEKTGAFIPLCTKNVFLKYYTKETESIQMTFWSKTDADDYFEAIGDMLKNYYAD